MKVTVEIDSSGSRPKRWRLQLAHRLAAWTQHHQPWRAICLAAALLWPFFAQGHTSEDILSVTVTNYSGYVIDSDGNYPSSVYNRDAIRVSSQVRFSTVESTVSTFEY